MDNVSGKWALVTGASSGFGVEFATLLAEQKVNLILAARRTEAMQKLADQLRQKHRVNVVVEGIDLGRPGAGAVRRSIACRAQTLRRLPQRFVSRSDGNIVKPAN